MIYITESKSFFTTYLNSFLRNNGYENIVINNSNEIKNPSSNDILIFFKDPYIDNSNEYFRILSDYLDLLDKHNLKFIYIDSVHLYGLTEKTSISENDVHKPFSNIGKIREEAYEKIKKYKNIVVLRFPDFLGKGCNFFMNKFSIGKSNLITWPGSTYINHEFIYSEDALKVILTILQKDKFENYSEYNISGTKYTIEQIAAKINEVYGIPLKITQESSILLWIKSLKNPIYKNNLENNYLFKKPVYLNSSNFEKTYGKIEKYSLDYIVDNMFN